MRHIIIAAVLLLSGCDLGPSPTTYCWNMWNLRNDESAALGRVDPDIRTRAEQCDKNPGRLDDK